MRWPSSSITSSAKASPANGPPTLPASICTFSGSRMSADCAGVKPTSARERSSGSGTVLIATVWCSAPRVIVSVTVSPGCTRERIARSREIVAVERDGIDDDAGRPCDDLVAERPQRDRGGDALRDRHLAQVCAALGAVAHAGRQDELRRDERRAGADEREERLEHVRAA